MSIKYTTLSRTSLNRGPKSSQQLSWFTRRAALVGTTFPTVTVSIGAVPQTKGAWSQVIASTTGNIGAIRLRIIASYAGGGTGNGCLMDVGIGAAGSEVVIISNIAVGGATNQIFGGIIIDLPIAIPSGSRVALRAQSNRTASSSFSVQVTFAAPADPQTTPSSLDSLGVSTETSAGRTMSGASGTYVQIISPTTKDYQALIIVPSLTVSTATSAIVTYTVAVGSAGSEVDIYQMQARYDSGLGIGNIFTAGMLSGGGLVPTGSRISIKHNIVSNPGNYAVSVIGVPYV